ncbi:MAG: DUF2235 domain-containing protein [Planktothrix sp. GU0601_MAG3]|nr:MAG: DUF2235 domain-containing protein [Planktothrix sp. GU0601_MAG3]
MVSHYWKGSLAELYIWNQARTQEEIKQDMNRRLVGDELGLSTYLPLNGDVNDKTSYANDGIIYGTSWKLEKLPAKKIEQAPRIKNKTKTRTKTKKSSQSMNTNEPLSESEISEPILETVEPIITDELTPASEILETISETVEPIITDGLTSESEILETISETVEPIITYELTSEAEISEPILETVEPIITDELTSESEILETISETVEPIITDELTSEAEILETISETVEPIITDELTSEAEILETISETVEPIITDELTSASEILEPILEILEPIIIDELIPEAEILEPILEILEPIITDELTSEAEILEPIITDELTSEAEILETISETVESIITDELTSEAEILEPISETVESIITDELTSEAEILEPISETVEPIITEQISNDKILESNQLDSGKQKKRLVICCDGTWNQPASSYPTNVIKFAHSLKYTANDQTPQIVLYLSGYGTSEEEDLDHLIKRLGEGAFGWGIDRIIQETYRFLCMNYDVNAHDEIYLLGFSRGAYIVRSLAGMIYKCGLLKRSKIREISKAYQLYRDAKISPNDPKAQKFREENSQNIDTEKDYLQYRVPIKMLGCWDTVGTLGIPDLTPWLPIAKPWNQKYQFFDNRLSPIVENAFHAVAIDEKCKSFPATFMEGNAKNPDQIVKEVWFSGEHNCIGGGIKAYQGLSDYPLEWMLNQAKKLGLEFCSPENESEEFQIKPDIMAKFDNRVTGVYSLGGEEWRSLKSEKVIIHHSVVKRLKAHPDYRPKNLNPMLKDLIETES